MGTKGKDATRRIRSALPWALLVFFPAVLNGQKDSGEKPPPKPETQRTFEGKVFAPGGEPVDRATVAIESEAGIPCRVVRTNDEGKFRAGCDFGNQRAQLENFTVILRVSKEGFHTARKMTEVLSSADAVGIEVALRPLQAEDPALLSLAGLIASLVPRIRQLGPEDGLSAADQIRYAQGVHEFLGRNQLDQAVPALAAVARRNPSCLRCRTMLALAELAWGDWDGARQALIVSVNAAVADRKRGCAEPLLAYGVLNTWEHEPKRASAFFAEALKYSARDAFALKELGRAQCLYLDWKAGSESLKQALAAGAGPEARLMLAEALLRAGTADEANAELTLYLDGRDLRKMPPDVRELSERIRDQKKDEAASMLADEKARAQGEAPVDYLRDPPRDMPDFQPADDQAQLKDVLAAVGKNISKLFADLLNVSAVEDVQLEKINHEGKVDSSRKYEYLYLCLPATERWGFSFIEYRSDDRGQQIPRLGLEEGYMLTSGFVSAPLIFHPIHQEGSSFRLLGHQKLKSRDTVVIAYAQLPARSRIFGRFQDGNNARTIFKQGIAWVDAENFQIIRLASDLLKPLPRIGLEKQSTEIDFQQVQFNQEAEKFWLPEHVIVTLHWNGKVLRNTHAYSDFKLFNVQTTLKIGKPKDTRRDIREAADPAPLGESAPDAPSPDMPEK